MLPCPSIDILVGILVKQRHHAGSLHTIICTHGLQAHRSLWNHLFSVNAQSISFAQNNITGLSLLRSHLVSVDAQSIGFAPNNIMDLSHFNRCSWDSLIIGYVKGGEPRYALNLYRKSQELSLPLSPFTFVALLKGCTQLKEVNSSHDIYAHIEKQGWSQSNQFVGTALIDMFAKCGMLNKAQEVFDKLIVRDVVSWTTLIAGYAQHEHGEEALNCFRQMQLQGVSPNAMTYACTLKACSSFGDLDKGTEIHADIERKDLLKKNFVIGTALVDMYAKCGTLVRAREVFDTLPVQNLASWNALATGYAQHEQGEEALYCFEQVQLQGIPPDGVTFACGVKACGNIGRRERGKNLHAQIEQNGLVEIDQVLGTALIDMYAKFGMLTKAREVFEELPVRDVVSWSALIAGYVQHKRSEEALACFEQMQLQGLSPNAVTFACSLKACGSMGATQKGREIHDYVEQTELLSTDQVVGNALIDMYAKCGLLAKAREVFDKLPAQNIVSWNSLITGYAQIGEFVEVLSTCESMERQGITPDLVTFVSILNACSHAGLVDGGQTCFWVMNAWYGITPNADHHTCMINLLARAGQLDRALAFISRTPSHLNMVAWLTLLGACRKWGDVELGRLAFERAVQLDEEESAAYVCMSNIYGDCGMEEDVAMA